MEIELPHADGFGSSVAGAFVASALGDCRVSPVPDAPSLLVVGLALQSIVARILFGLEHVGLSSLLVPQALVLLDRASVLPNQLVPTLVPQRPVCPRL